MWLTTPPPSRAECHGNLGASTSWNTLDHTGPVMGLLYLYLYRFIWDSDGYILYFNCLLYGLPIRRTVFKIKLRILVFGGWGTNLSHPQLKEREKQLRFWAQKGKVIVNPCSQKQPLGNFAVIHSLQGASEGRAMLDSTSGSYSGVF